MFAFETEQLAEKYPREVKNVFVKLQHTKHRWQ